MSKGDNGNQEAWILGPALSPTCRRPCNQSQCLFRLLNPKCQATGGRGKAGLGNFPGPINTSPLKFCGREMVFPRISLAVGLSEAHSNEK